MNSLLRGAGLALALLFFGTTVASADPFLDFATPPTGSSGTAKFVGDWATKTGTLTISGADVNGLIFGDGTTAPPVVDAVMNATVDLTAKFVGGALVADTGNLLDVAIVAGSYYKATIYSGTLSDLGFVFTSSVGTDTSGLGLPVVDATPGGANYSKWIDQNSVDLSESGASLFLFGVTSGSLGSGSTGITNLVNINGKLTPTPEPGSIALCGLALVGFVAYRRRRKAVEA